MVLRKVKVRVLQETRYEVDKTSGKIRPQVIRHRDRTSTPEARKAWEAWERMEAQEARRASTMVSEEQKRHEKDSRFRDKKWEEDQKVLEKRKANQDRLAALHVEGFLEEPIERSKPGEVRCGACGLWGHNKSARSAPSLASSRSRTKPTPRASRAAWRGRT